MNMAAALSRLGLRGVAQLVSPGGNGASLVVLMYHRVLPAPDPLFPFEPDAARFTEQMNLVASLFNVLPLTEAVARLRVGSLPPRAVCITFDDGYANNFSVAAPILRARKLPAVVYVATGFIDSGRMWNDTVIESVRAAQGTLELSDLGLGRYDLDSMESRRAAIDGILGKLKYLELQARLHLVDTIAAKVGLTATSDLMMSTAQLRSLPSMGIEIGAHTVNHPILARLDDAAARNEMLSSKRQLEEIIGERVLAFAYPNGRPGQDYLAQHAQLARECGFSSAVSTAWGAARKNDDVFQLPRIAPWDRTDIRFALRIISSYRSAKAAVV